MYPSKESIQSQMIDVDKLYPDKTDAQFSTLLKRLQQQQALVDQSKGKWSDYFKNFQEGEKWQIDFVQNTDLQKASLDDVKKGYENARQAALTHNAALKQQTLSAKAGKIALQGLAMAGNAIVGALAGIALNLAISKFSDLANKEEIAAEKAEALSATLNNFQGSISEGSKKIEELSEKYDKLSEGVSSTGMNISLTDEEYSEYKNTISALSEIMPNLTTMFNEQGEKIGFVGGKIENTTKKYREYIKTQAQDYLRNGDEENTVQDVLNDYKYANETNTYGWSNIWRDSIASLLEVVSLYDLFSGFEGAQGKIDWGSELFGAEAEFSIQEQLDTLESLLNTSKDDWQDILNDSDVGDSKQANLVEELLGINVDEVANMSNDEFNTLQQGLNQKINAIRQTLDSKARNTTSVMQQMLFGDDDYWNIKDDKIRDSVVAMFSGLNNDALQGLNVDLNNQNSVETWIASIVDAIKSNKNDVSDAIKELFSFDIGDLSPEEAKNKIDKYIEIIAKLLYGDKVTDEQENTLKKSLGFDTYDNLNDKYSESISKTKETYKDAKKMQGDFDWDSWFKKNSINTEEEIDKWNKIVESTNNAEEARKKYLEADSTDIPQNFKDAWKQYSTDETTKESAEKLKELAESGSLTVKAFEGINGAEEYFEKIGLSAEEATKKINNLVDETKPLSTLKTNIGSLQTAYTEKKDDGVVGADTLSGMEETFGDLDYWDKYKQILGSSTSSLKQCREAQNKLATQYVRSKNFLSGLVDETGKCTKANRQYYIEQLKELGIKNATFLIQRLTFIPKC